MIKTVLKAMMTALVGKVERPDQMLTRSYSQLQSAARIELAQALALEASLKARIEHLERVNGPTSQTKEQLRNLQEEIPKLRRRLEELEQQYYKGRQMFNARNNGFSSTLVCEEILVGKAITEDGATYDREIAPTPTSSPNYVLIVVSITLAMMLAILWKVLT